MFNGIEVIIFDMGGTLRGFHERDVLEKEKILQEILDILNSDIPVNEFGNLLADRSKSYSQWARKSLIELNEQELWTQWMLPDFPDELVRKNALVFTRIWRQTLGTRLVFPETKQVLTQLFRNGYRIGLVSNTTTSVEVPEILKELEISGIVETVILSCNVGIRKPDPRILLMATEQLGVNPSKCVYVGDRLDRDVAVSRNAGFSKAIILRNNFYAKKKLYNDPDLQPDAYIDNLSELLSFFPPQIENNNKFKYQSSLSTMWAKGNFPSFSDFFIAAGRLGFPEIELNHMVNNEMLDTVDLDKYKISSVHEPCPADIPVGVLKEKDWLISSTNEEKRIKGVDAVKKSIDLAVRLNAAIVVIHCGQVRMDLNLEKKLREFYEAGMKESQEYAELKQNYVAARKELVDGNMVALKKSLHELLEHSKGTGVKLGLENRYHYFDIPTPEEMNELLSLADSSRLGFILDVGHAQAMEQLGFFPFKEWLDRFSNRIIEVHIHDVKGITDHFSPGIGDIDFNELTSYFPKEALKIMELHPINSPDQIHSGMNALLSNNIIKSYK